MKKRRRRIGIFVAVIIIGGALFIGSAFGVYPLVKSMIATEEENEAYEQIVEEAVSYEISDSEEKKDAVVLDKSKINKKKKDYPSERAYADFDALSKKNSETIGWIQIPSTPINYPVVYSKDANKYLNVSFNGKRSIAGAIFCCGSLDFEKPSQNITIYGHNMGYYKTGMFSMLRYYKEKSFYNNHSLIYFSTPYRTGTYKIFAAFNIHVPNTFNYTQSNFLGEKDFLEFIREVKKRSFYDMGVEVTKADEIITLSTCDRTFDRNDGRLVVMAVRIAD